ncbi:MAG: hypothetical protein ACJA2N_000149 [Salibacteraceae bacterium]|jgi:hypothetical protein
MKKVLHLLQSDQGLFLCILSIGAFLRFYHPLDIPFTHDELSALNRLKFDSFSQLIEGGVKVDGHPALIQVFLYYWTAIFGYSEFLVKLPFLVLGLGSIYLIYQISKSWANPTAALLSASFMATLQFPITFSQIARPYTSGLFFCLLFVYFWNRFLFQNGTSKAPLLGMIIAAALCSYNHYFSLMFAGIVGITGLFFLNKETYKPYLVGMLTILLLFTPHLSLFLFQFSGKGLDWLGAPTPYFIIQHIQYIFHFSFWVYLLVILIIGYGIYDTQRIKLSRFQLISLTWFLLPIIIGIGYSILVKPVIQHSMLLFSFPFLILFITSFVGNWNHQLKQAAIGIILVINISTLVFSREHYTVFYNQPFAKTFNFSKNAHNHYSAKIILNDNPRYFNFYFDTSEVQFQSNFNSKETAFEFRKRIRNTQNPYLVLGNIPLNLVDVAQEFYPILLKKESGLNYNVVLLAKSQLNKPTIETILYSSEFSPTIPQKNWLPFSSANPNFNKDVFTLNSEMEYGPIFEKNLNNIVKDRYGIVKVSLDFLTNHMENGLITVAVFYKDQQISWKGISIDEYQNPQALNIWNSAYLNVNLTQIIKYGTSLSDYKIKVLYWNKDQSPIELRNFKIRIAKGNKYEFATIEQI